ncbi:IclR family transcriptional regulator [Georgenia sp. Z1491]|uniref:IclR family transcriptional regulator n=1 Tax=Georgenia sp. Z1491 TaxID=3416707 RepID=UPI003CF701AF
MDRAMLVLDVLSASSGPLPVKDVAARADLDRTTTHRLLKSLAGRDLAEQGENGWRLGVGTFRLGRIYLDSLPFTTVAPAYALDLFRSQVQHRPWSVVVSLLLDDAAAIVDRYWSDTAPLSTVLEIGALLPLDRSATGLALLATMSDDEVRRRVGAPRATELEELIDEARADGGLACVPHLLHNDVHAVACAVRGPSGAPVGAINVNGVDIEDQLRPDSELARGVKRAADRISVVLSSR